jgi:hypothetical protein
MGDLPKSKNTKSGHIVMGDLPRWKKYEKMISLLWVTYPDGKNMNKDLIVMSDLSKWKKYEKRSHCNG